jgi:uncharacterized protein (UPF0335 family)
VKKNLTIILLIIFSIVSFSRTITGSGKADSAEEAKQAALRDISQQIQVKVISEFAKEETVAKDNTYTASKSNKVKLSSANDILGVEFFTNEIKGVYIVEAFINESSIPLYNYEINQLNKKIELNIVNSTQTEDLVFKRNYLVEALEFFDKWEAYTATAIVLGSDRSYEYVYSKAYITNEIEKINRVLEQKKVIYVQVDDEFDDMSNNKFLLKEVKKLLNSLSKEHPDTFRLTNDTNKKNITLTVNIDSFFVDTVPPVFYNKKLISNESYSGDVALTFIIFNELTKNRLASFSVDGSAKSFRNETNAIDKSIKKIMMDKNTQKQIKKALLEE